MSNTQIHAPEIPVTLEWFNTSHPLRIADQRGKVVLLDFWTYCCINCMHILPDIAYLEQKYPANLTVIGIHSPKFPHEHVSQQVQKAINRYQIHHPVAHDPELTVWQTYGIRAWPSIVLIDPEGYLICVVSGEGRREQLEQIIAKQLLKAEKKGFLVHNPMPVKLSPEPETLIQFPGKIHATAQHLYISDSGHHRVLETDWHGKIQRCFGNGKAGLSDGHGESVQFNDPQGLIRVDDKLYLADTKNHAIRRIDLMSGQVDTIAGTGQQGRYIGEFFTHSSQVALNSPWDLAFHNGVLYIAMAGQHQIWLLNLALQTIYVFAGSGREDIIDGDSHRAAFAQPSGLSLGQDILYVADAETSAVRAIDLPKATTNTLIGSGLFVFGDREGIGTQARLQHPLAVAWDQQRQGIWIADTYNNKIKWLDIKTQEVRWQPMDCCLDEPGGLSLYENTLWIANTNAHQIVRYEIENQQCSILMAH